jgi:class 3 adenylate cyclase/outer membrane protein assembly factor BamB
MTAERGASGATHGLLFADLRGYSAFVEEHGDEAAVTLLARYRRLVREVVASHAGAEIRTEGDSFYVVFPLASGAVRAGLAILEAARAAEPPIDVGIGVQAGETSEGDEGPIGSAVNIAARVCSQARPGELLVTDTVRALTRTRLPVRFVPRGSPRLKGITEPIPLFAVLPVDELADARPRLARRGQLATDPRFWIGGAAALVLVAAVVAFAARGSGASPPSSPSAAAGFCGKATAAPSSSRPIVSPPATLPPVGDVTAYRGNAQRTGVYPGPGPVCPPEIVWQQRLGRASDFVPIVADGAVIVGDSEGLHAFDAQTGAALWPKPFPGRFTESAATDNGTVFAADLDGQMHAVDVLSGAQRWQVPFRNSGTRPIVAQGLLWAGSSDGHAHAFDPATGATRWTWSAPAAVDVATVTADMAYLTSAGSLFAVRLVDGTQLWRFDGRGTSLTGPIVTEDTIYTASQGTGQLAMYALDRATGHNRWGPPFAIASGRQVNPSAVANGIVYVATDGDGIYALRDIGSAFEVVWHQQGVKPATFRPASLAGGVLYVQPNESSLVALRASDGARLWETSGNAPGTETPIVSGGIVFQVNSESNVLRAWAEPELAARLGAASPAPSPSPGPAAPDPFVVTATYPWFQTGIQIPAAIAIGPDQMLYVLHAKADYSNPEVTIVDPRSGRAVASWGRYGSGRGELDLTASNGNGPGGCIQVDRDGLVYVGERGNQRVEVFKRDGTFVRQIGAGELGAVLFCQLGADGSLYVGNDQDGPFGAMMARFSPSGRLEWRHLTDPAHPNYAFQVHGFVLLPNGRILGFIDSGGAVIMDPVNGKVVGRWSTDYESGASGEPSLDPAGNVYVFTYVPEELLVFDPKGRLLGKRSTGMPVTGPQFDLLLWPPTVFDSRGFGYTFGHDGLVQLKVSLPTH